jgi:predicted nucleic acid-binding protein
VSRCAVLDAEALNALLNRKHPSRRQVQSAVRAAVTLRRPVVVATVTLSELYRRRGRSQALDALLAGEQRGLRLRDTDRALARLAGALLHESGMGSEHLVDAHAVALAVEAGGGVVLTGDPDDLGRLAGPYAHVTVVPLRDSRSP